MLQMYKINFFFHLFDVELSIFDNILNMNPIQISNFNGILPFELFLKSFKDDNCKNFEFLIRQFQYKTFIQVI